MLKLQILEKSKDKDNFCFGCEGRGINYLQQLCTFCNGTGEPNECASRLIDPALHDCKCLDDSDQEETGPCCCPICSCFCHCTNNNCMNQLMWSP